LVCSPNVYFPVYNVILVLNLFLFIDNVSKVETRGGGDVGDQMMKQKGRN